MLAVAPAMSMLFFSTAAAVRPAVYHKLVDHRLVDHNHLFVDRNHNHTGDVLVDRNYHSNTGMYWWVATMYS